MAIQLREEAGGKVLVVSASGKLTKEDYDHFMPEVERLIKQHGRIRMLFDMHDFHGWKAGALWEDTKFAFKHYSDLERLAVVGEKAWEQGMAAFCRPFTKAELRYFDRSEADKADEWIRAGLPVEHAVAQGSGGY